MLWAEHQDSWIGVGQSRDLASWSHSSRDNELALW